MHNARVGLYDTGAATHVGNVRQRNEDSYLARPEAGIWAVADGMGGHESGDLASQTVIAALQSIEMPKSAADLLSRCEDGVATANGRLKEIPGQVPALTNLPPGCSFAPRCPYADERCRSFFPPYEQKRPGHWAACWHSEKLYG